MSPFAVSCAERADARLRRPDGVALVAVLLILVILSAIGLGLSLTTGLEPAASANYECAWRARYAAEAGVAAAFHDLANGDGWDAALAGGWRAPHLAQVPGELVTPDGTRLTVAALTNAADCGDEAGCSEAERTAFTADRPWGPNNPRWQPVGLLRADGFDAADRAGSPGVVVVVWVGDDPAELDGDPLRDSVPVAGGARAPGACVMAIRAEAFSARAAHRTVTATVLRSGPGCWPGPRVVSWRTAP